MLIVHAGPGHIQLVERRTWIDLRNAIEWIKALNAASVNDPAVYHRQKKYPLDKIRTTSILQYGPGP